MNIEELSQSLRELDNKILLGSNPQVLDNGKEYKCCIVCGLSPLRLAEILEALSNQQEPRSAETPDATPNNQGVDHHE